MSTSGFLVRNDSINTGYDDKYTRKFHVGTEAREISTLETEVSVEIT